ncbi:radical SAM protein [Candidatus Bathyarchaeota archaeon]|nr:radical SAM protein [Candidatus Bathyarchaeota archaeon]
MVPVDQYFAVLGRHEMVMLTSRGCPFSCRFCSVPQSSHRKWRAHSVDRVLSEMETAKTIGATDIMFEDDNMSLNKDRYCRILEAVVKQNWGLHLGARNLLLTTLDKDVLTLMKRAGFAKVPVSAESGCDRVLAEEMGKKLTIAETERVVRESVEVGLKPFLNFVIGMPGEKWGEIEKTAEFARRMKTLGADGFWFSVATPICGTAMFQELVDKEMLPSDFMYRFSYGRGTFDGPDWTKEQIQDYRKMLMEELNS